jgi:hypothetical protein
VQELVAVPAAVSVSVCSVDDDDGDPKSDENVFQNNNKSLKSARFHWVSSEVHGCEWNVDKGEDSPAQILLTRIFMFGLQENEMPSRNWIAVMGASMPENDACCKLAG